MAHVRVGLRRLSVLSVMGLAVTTLAVVAGQRPALGTHDGPPHIGEEGPSVPQIHRPSGGGAVRIYGEGLLGTTAVTIGGVAAPDFRVVDGDLIIATVPPAGPGVNLVQNDGFAHIVVTDDEGSATTDLDGDGTVDLSDCTTGCATFGPELGAIFYTDATFTLNPQTGLDGGDTMTVTLTGHRPNQGGWPIVHLNPLVNFLEDGPEDPDTAPPGPPYGSPVNFVPTDANGNLVANITVLASPTFNSKDQDYDPDADCPVAQVTANAGLDRCIIGYSEFGMASMETYFSYSPDAPNVDPVPAAPTLVLSPTTGPGGTSVSVSGVNWNAAPHFGSDTTPDDPGESSLLIDVCNVALTTCTAASSPDAEVAVTRYFDSGPDPDTQPVTGVYTGATLSGSAAIPSSPACAPNCVVRVRQQRYNIETNAPVAGTFITATAPFTVPGPNQPPVANDDSYNTPMNTSLNVAAPGVLGNDTDANGDALSAGSASDPPHGGVTLSANGSFTYTPDANFTGTDTFTYTASDGNGGTDTATVTVNVVAADVSVTMTGPPGALVRSTFNYSATVSNAGPSTATGVTLHSLPAGATLVSATPSQGTCTASSKGKTKGVNCQLGSLTSGQGVNVTITVKTGTKPGTVTNTATVSAVEPDPTTSNNTTPLVTTTVTR